MKRLLWIAWAMLKQVFAGCKDLLILLVLFMILVIVVSLDVALLKLLRDTIIAVGSVVTFMIVLWKLTGWIADLYKDAAHEWEIRSK